MHRIDGFKGFENSTRVENGMIAIMLIRIDSRRNITRYYKLDVQPTLFGEWSFIREWGRIGRPGTVRIETLRTPATADITMALDWVRKRKRGYR
jgi:predicted DNA-binding WGR domain protein